MVRGSKSLRPSIVRDVLTREMRVREAEMRWLPPLAYASKTRYGSSIAGSIEGSPP
jgi:hypothetical protein